jgi:transglutaminase-like putative cysteine protease
MSPAIAGHAFLAAVIAVAGAIALHLRWLPLPLSLAIGGVVLVRALQRRRRGTRVPWFLRLAVLAALVALVVATVGNPLGREGGSALLSAMLALKLLETETVRDARVAVASACFLAMAAFLYDQGPIQCLFAAAELVLVLGALHELASPTPPPAATIAWRPGTLRFSLRLLALAIPFGLVCFGLFPRMSSPIWGSPDDAFTARSGVSDRMEPGGISSLALDDTPVFRVQFEAALPPPGERYWRGLVLWAFDGRAWSWPDALRSFPENEPRLEPLVAPTRYDITMEPTDQRWRFVLDAPMLAPEDATLQGDFQVRGVQPASSVVQYRASSVLRYRMQVQLPRLQRAIALRLPSDGDNPQARALARTWADAGMPPREIAEAALALFNESFIYSLDPPPLAANPIDDFLFETRTGFCEHFASTFVYLMRAAGVPARVVVGFQGGLWNASGGYLVVRRADAHAWTEIWLEGEGWIRVDPTAAVAPERVEASAREAFASDASVFHRGWLRTLAERWDLVGHWWNQAVVQFSALRQRNFIESIGLERAGLAGLAGLLLVGSLAAVALAGWLARPRRAPLEPALAAWRKLGARLAAAGVPRLAAEGPVDFAERAAGRLPGDARDIRSLSERFVALRYAASKVEAGELAGFVRDAGAFRPRDRWQPPATERRRATSSKSAGRPEAQ